jgi:hypothetical protein
MSSPPTAPSWFANHSRAERGRLSAALREADEACRLFWEAQSSCVRRIYQEEEQLLSGLSDSAWDREFAEQKRPGDASYRLAQAVEELKRLGVPVPPPISDAVCGAGRLDIMVRNTPPSGRRDLNAILQLIQEQERRGRKSLSTLRAVVAKTAPPGHPGRPTQYPKGFITLVRRMRDRRKTWKEVYNACKEKYTQVRLPNFASFRRDMQRRLKE